MNYNVKLNLMRFKNACVITVKGKNASKRGVFIPIEDNNMFISADDDLNVKGAFVDGIAWENKQVGKYGDTHSIRQSLPKEVRDKMSEEELLSIPYFGNMKPYELTDKANSVAAPVVEPDPADDLPF